jgi:hypothetical protein
MTENASCVAFPSSHPNFLAEAMHYYEAHQAEIDAEMERTKTRRLGSDQTTFRTESRQRTRETRRGQTDTASQSSFGDGAAYEWNC